MVSKPDRTLVLEPPSAATLDERSNAGISGMAAAGRIDGDHVGWIVEMMLLWPCIVEAVLPGRQTLEFGLPTLTSGMAKASQSLPGR